jgi:DNA-binding transcriptional ArsR family regulator
MPSPAQDLTVPDVQPIAIGVEPVLNTLHSVCRLLDIKATPGLGDWVTRTAAALTAEERKIGKLIFIGLYYAILPEENWPDFAAYLDHLASCDPTLLRAKILKAYTEYALLTGAARRESDLDPEAALESVDAYLSFLRRCFNTDTVDEELEAKAYSYMVDPPAMQELIVTYLRDLWERFLAAEWERVRPVLQEAVTAFRQIDFGTMSRFEAAGLITGQAVEECPWASALEEMKRVVFVPTMHIGPYVATLRSMTTLWVFFGARIPEGVAFHAPDLSRAEIVVRLDALGDDNRLRILKLVSEKGELRSQEIIETLSLSRSAASRHLKQLSANGYLTERRCNGAKCYKLNPERIRGTLRAISTYLLGD